MLIIGCTPRSMSAWLSNLFTVPGHSLYIHDPRTQPGLIEALARYEIPRKGVVYSAGSDLAPKPDYVILGDPSGVKQRTGRLFGRDMSAETTRVFDQLRAHDVPTYRVADMDAWIRGLYEECTGLTFDPVRYACLLNLHVESVFAASLRQGSARRDGLHALYDALTR